MEGWPEEFMARELNWPAWAELSTVVVVQDEPLKEAYTKRGQSFHIDILR